MTQTNRRKQCQGAGVCVLLVALMVMALGARAQAQTNAPVLEKKSDWQGSAALGLSVTRGNSDTLLVNGNLLGTKKWTKNELRLGLDATYGENNGEKNNEQVKGFSQYNRFFDEADRWFLYGRVEALHDAIADVKGRFTLSPGVGYYFIKNEKMSLSGEGGPGLVIEKIDNSGWDNYFTARAAERFEYKINDRAKLWQTAEIIYDLSDFRNYIINAEIGIETAITKQWALRVVLQNSYDNEPAPGRLSNDLKLIAGVSYKF